MREFSRSRRLKTHAWVCQGGLRWLLRTAIVLAAEYDTNPNFWREKVDDSSTTKRYCRRSSNSPRINSCKCPVIQGLDRTPSCPCSIRTEAAAELAVSSTINCVVGEISLAGSRESAENSSNARELNSLGVQDAIALVIVSGVGRARDSVC